jgi:hypothetical protein
MSDLWLNIRFGYYHLQIKSNFKGIRFSYNLAQKMNSEIDKNWKWFEIHELDFKKIFVKG